MEIKKEEIENVEAKPGQSTGPRTPEGKAVSKMNNLKHGWSALSTLLPDEDPVAYETMASLVREDLRPIGIVQELLVDRITALSWRQLRLGRVEPCLAALALYGAQAKEARATAYSYEQRICTKGPAPLTAEDVDSLLGKSVITNPGRHAEALEQARVADAKLEPFLSDYAHAFVLDCRPGGKGVFEKFHRHERQTERSLAQALATLRALQDSRPFGWLNTSHSAEASSS